MSELEQINKHLTEITADVKAIHKETTEIATKQNDDREAMAEIKKTLYGNGQKGVVQALIEIKATCQQRHLADAQNATNVRADEKEQARELHDVERFQDQAKGVLSAARAGWILIAAVGGMILGLVSLAATILIAIFKH